MSSISPDGIKNSFGMFLFNDIDGLVIEDIRGFQKGRISDTFLWESEIASILTEEKKIEKKKLKE